MNRWEKLYLGMMFGFIMPVVLLLAGWWGSLGFVPEDKIKFFALGGFIIGTILNIILLRRWVSNAYSMKTPVLVAIYIFYTVGTFGFFMGVPLFNLLTGLIAGIYVGRRLQHCKADSEKQLKGIKAACIFTTAVIAVICIMSAAIALSDPHTPANLRGMLGLKFEVTAAMVYGIITLGGLMLVLLQYWLTRAAAFWAFRADMK